MGPDDSTVLTWCIPCAYLKAPQCAGVFGTACVRAGASNPFHFLPFLSEGAMPICLCISPHSHLRCPNRACHSENPTQQAFCTIDSPAVTHEILK